MTSNQRKLQIFISSTFIDLKRERQTAVSAILENGHIPAGMELFAAGDEEQMQVIRRWIDQSDIFLLILGKRYGSVEPNSGKSYTQLEYEYALEKKVPFFAIVLTDTFIAAKIRAGESVESTTEQIHSASFHEFSELVKSKMCSFADDHKDIKLKIWQSIRDLESRYEFSGWISADEMPDNSKILDEITSITKASSKLQVENSKLKEKIQSLETKLNHEVDYDGRTFADLFKLLNKQKIKVHLEGEKEIDLTLLKGLNMFAATLVGGLTNSAGASRNESEIFHKVAQPLAVYGMMEADKVPAKVLWKRLVLSKLGQKFIYELRSKNDQEQSNNASD